MKIISQKYGYKPLAVTASRVFLSKGRKIYVSDHDLQNIRYFARIPFRRRRDVFAGLRAVDRVLRLSINTMIAVSDRVGYLNVGADIWRVDLQNGSVTLDFDIPHGRKALTLTVLPNFKGNETTIVFGDYFPNGSGPMLGQGKKGPKTGQVHIWMRTHDDEVSTAPQWQLLDKFDDNTVDHIHAIVSAPDGSDIFALVGDIGENVGFWKWNQDQNNFQPHRVGKQIYRSTWAAVRKGHLIYATDTQLEQNFLILLRDGQSRVEMIAQIEGSSIYASPVKGGVLFSSTVEPGKPSGNKLKDVLEKKPGPGILSNQAKLYYYDFDTKILATGLSAEKDFVPARLGQFGSFMVPTGMEHLSSGRILAFGNALADYDNRCLLIQL